MTSLPPTPLLVVTKGHPYDHGAFHAMLDALGAAPTVVEQPAAQVLLRPENVSAHAAVLFYDMSGIDGGDPPEDYVHSIEALLESGTGIVMLNHGLLSWPAWPRWREISGTSFLLGRGVVRGQTLPGSGYRGGMGQPDRNARTRLSPAGAVDHPVLEGLADGFEIVDELYLKSACFEPFVEPLLRSDYDFRAENFSPPPLAAPEEQASWTHPQGSDVVAWANAAGHSPVVATDLGDGPAAYANPSFRRFVGNAVRWVGFAGGARMGGVAVARAEADCALAARMRGDVG